MTEVTELGVVITPKTVLPSFAVTPRTYEYETPQQQWSPDDEYNISSFTPLTLREDNLPKGMTSHEKEAWNEKFRYLSTTKGLEVNTDRTRIIEDKLREAAEKAGEDKVGKTLRVVILNKGLVNSAFLAPDNTIFITQNLIHRLGFFDLIMGVAAHEMGHAVDGFYENIGNLDPTKMLSVDFLSESSADLRTPGYLDSLGLNSTGLELALAKLEEANRGQSGRSLTHQELTQRRVALLALHKLQHFQGGTKPLTPLPPELDREAKPTNLELLSAFLKEGNFESAADTLPKLCKSDLGRLYKMRSSILETRGDDQKYTEANRYISRQLNQLLCARLTKAGYNDLDIKYFLLDLQRFPALPIDHEIIKDPNELVEVAKRFEELETSGFCERLSEEVFESRRHTPGSEFLTVLSRQMREYQDTRFPTNEGIPVTSNTLLEVLKELSTVIEDNKFQYLRSQITEALFTYASVWLDTNKESVRSFFERAKALGLSPEVEDWKLDSLERETVRYFGDHKITIPKEKLASIRNVFADVFVGKVEEKPREVTEKPVVNEDYIKGIFAEITGLDDSQEKAKQFDRLLYELRNHFDEQNLADAERLKLLKLVFNQIDALPLDRTSFYMRGDKHNFDENLPDLLKIGEAWKFYDNPAIKQERNMDLVKKIASFNLKMIAALTTFKEDGVEFYDTLQELMNTSGLDIESMSAIEIMRLCRPLFSLDYKGVPQDIVIIGFGVNSQERVSSYRVEKGLWGEIKTPSVVVVKNISKLENVPILKGVIEKQQDISVRSLDELVALSDKTRRDCSDFFHTSYPGYYESYYDDNLGRILLGAPVRIGLVRYLERENISHEEFDKLHDFLKDVLPESPDKDEILRGLRKEYLRAPIPLAEKINFFKKHGMELGIEGLVTLASQIHGEAGKTGSIWSQWEYFRDELKGLIEQYIKGEKSAARIAVIDSVTSYLSDKHELVLASCDASAENAANLSTKLASQWVHNTMIDPERSHGFGIREVLGEYNFSLHKFLLTIGGRVFFRSFDDLVKTLHSMSMEERAGILMKALVGNQGALSTEERRKKLGEFIKFSLQLKDPFISELAETLCEQAIPGTVTRTVFATLGSYLMGNLLFSGIKTDAVDVGEILNQYPILKDKIDPTELKQVLASGTREISAFAVQYQHQPASRIATLAQESDEHYSSTINFLRDRFIHKVPFKGLDVGVDDVPRNVEALFRGAEMTILGTRSIQTTRQMRRFDNKAVDRRMAKSFDANPGMDPLRFFLTLDSYAKLDPNLSAYLKNNLIDIEGFLAGGSMASTYKARAMSTKNPGEEVEVVIRVLTPGADLEIIKIGETFLRALDTMAGRPRRPDETKKAFAEKQKNIRLAQAVLRFTMEWCLADIRDPNYELNDDRFKNEVVTPFNKTHSGVAKVPEREFTSEGNWVRVETLASGRTVREYLDDPNVTEKAKSDVVWLMAKLNHFQFGQDIKPGEDALVQSDPSIGNYIVEESELGPILHVLDRGLMIPLNKKKLNMVRALIDGDYDQFLQSLVTEVVNYNVSTNEKYRQLDSRTRIRLETSLKAKIVFKVLLNKFFGRTRNLTDNLTTVNDVFIEEDLKLPPEIVLPLKNAAGISMLIHDYPSPVGKK